MTIWVSCFWVLTMPKRLKYFYFITFRSNWILFVFGFVRWNLILWFNVLNDVLTPNWFGLGIIFEGGIDTKVMAILLPVYGQLDLGCFRHYYYKLAKLFIAFTLFLDWYCM